MAVEYFQKLKQKAQALTLLIIKVQSIHYTNNDQAINACNFNWRL